ncbi:hypothetical protein [Flavobacterium sp.]|uniref:hypothetical protein n=1 Tax=Flavobacterium sp. TaxID=239 RepID=UPI0025BBE870|nr:hypothetical protein [Flavobacterium sp.]
MYTLYYLNRNYQLGTIKTDTLDTPILIPEDLVFCNLRKGINFIKEPHKCIDFTDTERLIITSEFTDTQLLKDYDFRKQNTYLTPLCPIEEPLILDSVTFASINWNYSTIVDVEDSRDNVTFAVYDPDKLNGTSNDNYYSHSFFRLHDKVRNIYSNVIEYYRPE